MRIEKIMLPNKPQFDPIAAAYILMRYGNDAFPNITNAEIFYWDRAEQPSADDIASWEAEGGIMIDVGGGAFDHHNKRTNGNDATAATLVAEYLGVDNNPELSRLLNYAREDDLEGLHNRYGELPYIIKCMHKQGAPNFKVVESALGALHYMHMVDYSWHHEAAKEFEEKCAIYRVPRGNKKIKIGVIESDNLELAKFGITTRNLAVVVQKRSSGHVGIMTNKHHRIDLREVIAAIRKRELEQRGYARPVDINRLKNEGNHQLVPNWYYHRSLNAFMNGTDALSNVEPTKIDFKTIIGFVLHGISSEPGEGCDCAEGGKHCVYRAYGFSKCM